MAQGPAGTEQGRSGQEIKTVIFSDKTRTSPLQFSLSRAGLDEIKMVKIPQLLQSKLNAGKVRPEPE